MGENDLIKSSFLRKEVTLGDQERRREIHGNRLCADVEHQKKDVPELGNHVSKVQCPVLQIVNRRKPPKKESEPGRPE